MLVQSANDGSTCIPWPKGAAVLYQVRDTNDRYVATYSTEAEARARAKLESDYFRDATFAPVYRTGA